MIPQAYITEWSKNVPWQANEQVEQDLVICRALVDIFKDNFLADNIAFRGGTALKKDPSFLTGLCSLTWLRYPGTRGLTRHHYTKVSLFIELEDIVLNVNFSHFDE